MFLRSALPSKRAPVASPLAFGLRTFLSEGWTSDSKPTHSHSLPQNDGKLPILSQKDHKFLSKAAKTVIFSAIGAGLVTMSLYLQLTSIEKQNSENEKGMQKDTKKK